jgi:hypothetical protein
MFPASTFPRPKRDKSHSIGQLQAFWFTVNEPAPVTLPAVRFIAKPEAKRAEVRL